jgi:hypothetical protein
MGDNRVTSLILRLKRCFDMSLSMSSIFAFLGEFVYGNMEYGQLRDSTKAKKLIAKNLGTLCRQHFAFNREIELVIHHPFLERFYREIVLRHEL